MSDTSEDRIYETFTTALANAACNEIPYRHWLISGLFPDDVLSVLQSLPFAPADLGGVSGKRELHNDSRHYFDRANIAAHSVMASIANAFQAPRMVRAIQEFFGADLEDTFLRIEYAQDVAGFWLQPHTDLGVKRLTVLIYLSDGPGHDALGTDIYTAERKWIARTPFAPNVAMAFVPNDHTFHGFEKRAIKGVRTSLILNYVTDEWRDREQLAFPEKSVSSS